MTKKNYIPAGLPESMEFKDTGCDIHPACLTCPLPQCRYDDPGWVRREERGSRNEEVLRMRLKLGLSAEEVAANLGVSTRTVHRILREGQPEIRNVKAAEPVFIRRVSSRLHRDIRFMMLS